MINAQVEAEKRAELEAPSLAMKRQTIVDSEAEREKIKITAQGEAEAILIKQEAMAKWEAFICNVSCEIMWFQGAVCFT